MPVAKTCECKHPLRSDDYCWFCTRPFKVPENPPRVEDSLSPEEIAVQMHKAGSGPKEIKEETGISDYVLLRIVDPDKHKAQRLAKYERALADPNTREGQRKARNEAIKAERREGLEKFKNLYGHLGKTRGDDFVEAVNVVARQTNSLGRPLFYFTDVGKIFGVNQNLVASLVTDDTRQIREAARGGDPDAA